MDGALPYGLAQVACRNCGLRMSVTTAIVHMGAADLFACPGCNHQEVWRTPVSAVEATTAWANGGAK